MARFTCKPVTSVFGTGRNDRPRHGQALCPAARSRSPLVTCSWRRVPARQLPERCLEDQTARCARGTPAFTGDLDKDFAGAEIVKYKKEEAAACRTAVAWDDTNLYVGWEVKDSTPWVNGADAPEFLYARGDTVDLQIGDGSQS